MKFLTLCMISLIFFGCASVETSIPESIFLNKQVVQKPKIENLGDMQDAYIELYRAYRKNLQLLETIEKINQN